MVSIVGLLIIAVTLVSAYAETLNVTSSVKDYVTISQHELLHEIDLVDVQIAAVEARYADRLDVIQYQQKKVLAEILQVNRTIMPMQALSLPRKHCIQKYDSQFVTYDIAKLQMDTCYNQAVNSGKSLTTNAKSYNSYARSAVLSQLPKNTVNCDSWYPKNQTALEVCYIDAVATASKSVETQLQLSKGAIEKSLYDADVFSRTATDCSFVVERNTLESIGEARKTIEICQQNIKKQGAVSIVSSDKSVKDLKIEALSGH